MSRPSRHGSSALRGPRVLGPSASCRPANGWLVQLWACFGLLVVMLAAYAATHAAAPSPATVATATAEAGAGDDRDGEPGRYREGESDFGPAREVGAAESETDDEDAQSGLADATPATALALASEASAGLRRRDEVDTGRSRISTRLARGPPILG